MTDAPTDPIDFEAQLPYWINRAGFLLRKELQDRLASIGIDMSAEEMAILTHIVAEADQTPTILADRTVRDRTTVTRLLDGLVKKGLVSRHVDPSDRRRVIVRTTPVGQETAARIYPVLRGLISDAVAGIEAEESGLALDVMRRLTANLLDLRSQG